MRPRFIRSQIEIERIDDCRVSDFEYFIPGDFRFFQHFIQHCFIIRPSYSTVSEDDGIKSNPGQLRFWHCLSDDLITRLDLIFTRLDLTHTWLDFIHTRLDLIGSSTSRLDLTQTRLHLIHTRLDLIWKFSMLEVMRLYASCPGTTFSWMMNDFLLPQRIPRIPSATIL